MHAIPIYFAYAMSVHTLNYAPKPKWDNMMVVFGNSLFWKQLFPSRASALRGVRSPDLGPKAHLARVEQAKIRSFRQPH
jgi:hypothetical protein